MAHSGYVTPVNGVFQRLDHGIDYKGTPGDSVVAIGDARVDAVKPDAGGFGIAIYYTLLTGPMKGQQIYVGHAANVVTAGRRVAAGAPVATLLQKPLGSATQPGWVEIGFASGGVPETGTAKDFQRFVSGMKTGDYSGVPPASPVTSNGGSTTSAGVTANDLIQNDQANQPPSVMAPSVDANVITPDLNPDLGMVTHPSYETWQSLAALPGASPDTIRLAQLAGLQGNAASGT